MLHIVMMSGGEESYAAGKLVVKKYGSEDTILLFADTKSEHPDLYRFLPEAAKDIGAILVQIADGRDIWQVMRDVKFLGNSQVDPCSRVLKRQLLRKWLEDNCIPALTTVYIGYRHDEDNRMSKCRKYWEPWPVEFPLATAGVDKCEIRSWLAKAEIDLPVLYEEGFPHNNCGGGCIKAGIGQFIHLLKHLPDSYAKWEEGEESLRQYLDADVTILKDRRQGVSKPMSLKVLRERYEFGETHLGRFEAVKSCGCFAPSEEES